MDDPLLMCRFQRLRDVARDGVNLLDGDYPFRGPASCASGSGTLMATSRSSLLWLRGTLSHAADADQGGNLVGTDSGAWGWRHAWRDSTARSCPAAIWRPVWRRRQQPMATAILAGRSS